MNEGQVLGQVRKARVLELRVHLLNEVLGPGDDLPDLPDDHLEEFEVPVFGGDDALPVPLVDVGAVVMVEEVVLADRAHVGVDAFADVAAVLLQGEPLPLRRRLHDLCVHPRADAEPAREVNRRARAVAVKVVIHAAFFLDDERHLHQLQVQGLGEAVLDVALYRVDRALGFLVVENRPVVYRQDLVDCVVGTDAGASEVSGLADFARRGHEV